MSMVPGSWQHQARGPGDGKLLAHASSTALKPLPGHHSLPRKKTPSEARNAAQTQQFQRAQSLRRSCLSPIQHHHQHHQHRQQESSLHFEYFVPRSVSEFNLAAATATDMVAPPPPPSSVLRPPTAITPPVASVANQAVPNQPRLLECSSTATRSREKMVTFEDEGVSCATSTPTRKNVSGIDNVFMWRNHGRMRLKRIVGICLSEFLGECVLNVFGRNWVSLLRDSLNLGTTGGIWWREAIRMISSMNKSTFVYLDRKGTEGHTMKFERKRKIWKT